MAGRRAGADQRLITEVPTSTGPVWILTLLPLYSLVAGLLLLLSGAGLSVVGGHADRHVRRPVRRRNRARDPRLPRATAAGIEQPASWAFVDPDGRSSTWSLGSPAPHASPAPDSVRCSPSWCSAVLLLGANVAVPGLIIQLAPATFSHQAEVVDRAERLDPRHHAHGEVPGDAAVDPAAVVRLPGPQARRPDLRRHRQPPALERLDRLARRRLGRFLSHRAEPPCPHKRGPEHTPNGVLNVGGPRS